MAASVFLALVTLATSIASAASGATLSEGPNGAGQSVTIEVGASLPEIPAALRNCITSLTLDSDRSIVVLYDEPEFSGQALVLNGRGPHTLADYEFDDCTASVRVVSLGQSASILELLATLIEDSVEYYELKDLREAQLITARWQESFVLGNERECRWEYLRLHPPQSVPGLAIDPVVSAQLYVRHCRRVNGVTLYNVAIEPRFECSFVNRCSGLTIDFGRIDVLNLHVRVPATNVVRFLQAWKN
jgi:hypothetical protein